MKHKYNNFIDWWLESENYSFRASRFAESLDAFQSNKGLHASMLVWLEAAFDAGREEAKKNETTRT